MQRLIAWYRRQTADGGDGYIPALDGLRALMVFLVASFHIWQQSWLAPGFFLLGERVSADYLLRSGYMWVDGMLLLSGFLLYLPYAAAREKGAPSPAVLPFYKKRFLRIYPGYALCIVVMLLAVALPGQRYDTAGDMAADVLAHLTFTFPFFMKTLHETPLNGALWTVAVEVHFYILFPLLARAFRRQPLLTYLGMTGAAFAYRLWAAGSDQLPLLFNQLPAYLDVYANGFVAASCYLSLKRRTREDVWTRIVMTGVLLMSLALVRQMLMDQAREGSIMAIRLGQYTRRYGLSAVLSLTMVSAALGLGGIRLALGNRLMRFLSGVSYQYYIWHQVLSVQLKHWGIPPSASPLPNQAGEIRWQVPYVLLCYFGALAIAALITYLFERPIARLGSKK